MSSRTMPQRRSVLAVNDDPASSSSQQQRPMDKKKDDAATTTTTTTAPTTTTASSSSTRAAGTSSSTQQRKSRLRRPLHDPNPNKQEDLLFVSRSNENTTTTPTTTTTTTLRQRRRQRRPTSTNMTTMTGTLTPSSLLIGLTILVTGCLLVSVVYMVVVLDMEQKTYLDEPKDHTNDKNAVMMIKTAIQAEADSHGPQPKKLFWEQPPPQPQHLRHSNPDKKKPYPHLDHQVVHINLAQARMTIRKNESNVIDMRQLQQQLAFDNPNGGVWKQGWDLTPVPVNEPHNPLTVLVVPHSHNDPGWIQTFDAYFQKQTKQILTTMVDALVENRRRTFVWAELSYFAWWWDEQTPDRQATVRQLLRQGQLEFVTGGWVMPDEANADLYAMEIQLQEGHDWIKQHLGPEFVPRYAWSIDPFGYSPTMAWLLQKYGMKAMLIQRVHYAVKKELAKRQHLEFYWRQTWDDPPQNVNDNDNNNQNEMVEFVDSSTAGEHDIFTHVMPFFSYDVPHTCGPDPAICCQFDFKRTRGQCPWKKDPQPITNHNVRERALLLWDQYKKKASLYRSNTVLVPLGDDFRYQTTAEAEAQFTNYEKLFAYINENIPGAHVQFGTLSDYFKAVIGTFDTPILKGSFFTYSDVDQDYWSGYFTSRVFDKALDRQLERVLYAAETMGGTKTELQEPRRALSLFQHHDGVTGTAKDHVVEDYAKRMYNAIRFTQQWMLRHVLESQPTLIQQLVGTTQQGKDSLKPCWRSDLPRALTNNMCGEASDVIAYNPLEIPQICGSTLVEPKQFNKVSLPCEIAGPTPSSNTHITFDPDTGLMVEPIKEEWKIWIVKEGGAYLFVPNTLASYDVKSNGVVIEDGGYVVTTERWKRTVIEQEIPLEFGRKAVVIDFIYETHLESDNQEWFTRFSTNIENKGVFHTDLNGFNFDTHYFRSDMPIQSQVFPMPTLASIEDSNRRMTVLSEHAQGTASLKDGSIDVWLDRRLRQDDGRGLGQGVQDNRPTRTRFRVLLEQEGYHTHGEFMVTMLGQRMWDQLQHPLETFGKHVSVSDEIVDPAQWRKTAMEREKARAERRRQLNEAKQKWLGEKDASEKKAPADGKYLHPLQKYASDFRHYLKFDKRGTEHKIRPLATRPDILTAFVDIVARHFTRQETVVPFVFMVYKRVSYLKKAINSLRKSDFPAETVPIIISHDGRVPEMMKYVESLKKEFNIVQIFHPFSCYEHPDTFPGKDPNLNVGYKGDMYGNPREGWATCCKHHFTWLLKTVFSMDFGTTAVDTFLFLEEDYVVGPSVYSTIVTGLNTIQQFEKESDGGFVGVGLDVTEANTRAEPLWLDEDAYVADVFHSGPMTMSRSVFERLQDHAEDYCKFDDYNWDWSYVHSAGMGHVPHTVLFPSRAQAKHIGIKEGMHADQMSGAALQEIFPNYGDHLEKLETKFEGKRFYGSANVTKEEHPRGYGGWGHPADQDHCMLLLKKKEKWIGR